MRRGREGQGSLDAIIQTEMKSSCKEGEASEGTGRKDGACEALGKGDSSCRMAEAAEGTSRKERVTLEVGEVADRRGSGERLERKGKASKLLVRRARGVGGSYLFAREETGSRGEGGGCHLGSF